MGTLFGSALLASCLHACISCKPASICALASLVLIAHLEKLVLKVHLNSIFAGTRTVKLRRSNHCFAAIIAVIAIQHYGWASNHDQHDATVTCGCVLVLQLWGGLTVGGCSPTCPSTSRSRTRACCMPPGCAAEGQISVLQVAAASMLRSPAVPRHD
jgi:hypothetical protein